MNTNKPIRYSTQIFLTVLFAQIITGLFYREYKPTSTEAWIIFLLLYIVANIYTDNVCKLLDSGDF